MKMAHIGTQEVLGSHLLTKGAKEWCIGHMEYLNKPMTLLGSSQKVEKGGDKRITRIMYLEPAGKVSTETLCAGASAAGCEGPCLISSGQLGMPTGRNAATKRTVLMLLRPQWFRARLIGECTRFYQRHGEKALVRLNGTSDIDFSDIIRALPFLKFYDYTKVLSRVRKNTLGNYDLTYSGSMYSTASRGALVKAITRGYRVAVAFNSKEVPEGFHDMDKTDLRPLDPQGIIGALTRKGSSKATRAQDDMGPSFFINQYNKAQFSDIIASTRA